MIRQMLKSKIHRAVVTETNLNYVGSITIDSDIMGAADIVENELVHVINLNNGSRSITYAIKGKHKSGVICLNGAMSRLAEPGDKIIVISYGDFENHEIDRYFDGIKPFYPKIIQITDEDNNYNVTGW